MKELRIQYVFRRPRYPVLCVVEDMLVAARTRQQLERRLARCHPSPKQSLAVIDASGEGWAFHTDGMVLSPMTMKKRWTKTELFELYRRHLVSGEAEGDGRDERDDKRWLKLRVDEVVAMIAALVERTRTPNPRLQRPAAASDPRPGDRSEATRHSGGR